MPTRRGRALLLAAVLLYLVAGSISIAELYPLVAAGIVFPVVASISVRLGRHRVLFARSVGPKRVFAGGRVRFEISARNVGRITSPPLIVEDPTDGGFGPPIRAAIPSLRAGERDLRRIERRSSVRGRYRVGPMQARLLDPFGLAEVRAEIAPPVTITVYPAIETLSATGPSEARSGTGRARGSRVAPAGEEFYAIREWQDGDDLRKIHWRSTARHGDLMIRQEEVQRFPRATIFLDTRVRRHGQSARGSSFEWGVSAAASLVWELAAQGFSLRLATPDAGPGSARWGREAVDPLLSALAVQGNASARSLRSAVRRLAGHGAGGALIAVMPAPLADDLPALALLARAYPWCGAVLLDVASFDAPSPRERAEFDQRLAAAERSLARAGWRVSIAGANDRFRERWNALLATTAYRPSSRPPRS